MMSGVGVRVSIPSNVRKTIQDIKEITGNHSEEEIYAMLKDCSMDPNETAQKLLLQDTFHEVKRKRDRKKENINSKESGDFRDSRRKPGTQGRGSRGGRVNFPSRYSSHDAGGGRFPGPARDNGSNQAGDKGAGGSLPASQAKSKETSPLASSVGVLANGVIGEVSGSTASAVHSSNLPVGGVSKSELTSSTITVDKLESTASHVDADKTPSIAFGTADTCVEPFPISNNSVSAAPASSAAVCFSSSDPVLVPSNDSRLPGTVGTIKREVGSNRTIGESNAVIPAEKSASEIGASLLQVMMPSKSQVGKGLLSDSSSSPPPSVLTHGGSSGSRPSSNYNNRTQQLSGLQKVGSAKEWKPKPSNTNVLQGSGAGGSSNVSNIPVEANTQSQLLSNVLDPEEATSKLQKKLEELQLPQRQHVIIPNHIHVPESERTKLSFGSFDASFGITTSYVSGRGSDKSSTPLSETSEGIDETVEERAPSNQEILETAEDVSYPDHPESPSHVPGNLSAEEDVSSSAIHDYNESKQETALLSGGQQYSVVHTSPSYSYGFVPPMLSTQIAPFENPESQVRDVSRLPSFVVQQPIDPTSYYAQFYRSGSDSDGRISPFASPAVGAKYNGNVAVLPQLTAQSTQEGGNSLVLSTAGPTPPVTQAAGLLQSSIAATQQPLPVFRPPTGLHMPHYPPNYIPYGPYFSPFYGPPPGIHQFLSNGAFPQQPQAGSVYPAPQAAAAMVKYSLPQYKPGTNTGNSNHIGMPSGYGPYGSSPAGYNPSSTAAGGNSTTNEDLVGSQFKESNVYITGQQSEGSAVWIAAPGRDMSSLPASSFYNLPPQGQHVTFTPTQAGHGTFANIYQPAQAVTAAAVHPLLQQSQTMAGAVDMVGSAASVYQQPQHQQINWPSNY